MTSRTVADCMTLNPAAVDVSDTLQTAAETMAQRDVGALVVRAGRRVVGIVTDRDLVVRGVAEGRGPDTRVDGIASERLVAVGPGDPVEVAVEVMREGAVRRVPVMDGDVLVGIVSLGDLAVEREPASALADIADAPPNG